MRCPTIECGNDTDEGDEQAVDEGGEVAMGEKSVQGQIRTGDIYPVTFRDLALPGEDDLGAEYVDEGCEEDQE